MWLDPTVESSWTLQTGVSQWNDLSGNGRNWSQTTANNQPSLTDLSGNPAFINGRRAFFLDGTNDNMPGNAAAGSLFSGIAGTTFFYVTGVASANPLNGTVFSYFGTGGAITLIAANNGSAVLATGNGESFVYRNASEPAATTRVLSSEWDVANNTFKNWLNGGLGINAAGSSATSATTSSTPAANPTIGRSFQVMRGQLGEIVVFRRVLTTEERTAMERYLMAKWGV